MQSVIDQRLKATGFKDGIDGDNFDVTRIKGPNGEQMLSVIPYDDETGAGKMVLIPMETFKDAARNTTSGRVAQGQPPRKPYTGPDPYRRIKGETGYQRFKRINIEVKAGGDAVKHGTPSTSTPKPRAPRQPNKAAAKVVGAVTAGAAAVSKDWTRRNDAVTSFRGTGPQRPTKK